MVKRSNRPNIPSHKCNTFLFKNLLIRVPSLFAYYKPNGSFPFQSIHSSHNSSLHHVFMGQQHFFHLCRRQSMSSRVNDIIQSSHHIQVPIFVEVPTIPGFIVPRNISQVLLIEKAIIPPQSQHESRRHWELTTDFPQLFFLFDF